MANKKEISSVEQQAKSCGGHEFEEILFNMMNDACGEYISLNSQPEFKNEKLKKYENEKTKPDLSFTTIRNSTISDIEFCIDCTTSSRDRNDVKNFRAYKLHKISNKKIINIVVFADDEMIREKGYKNPDREIMNINIAIANMLFEGKLTYGCIYCKASWLKEIAEELHTYQFKNNVTVAQVRRHIINFLKKKHHTEIHPKCLYKKYPRSKDMKNLCIRWM